MFTQISQRFQTFHNKINFILQNVKINHQTRFKSSLLARLSNFKLQTSQFQLQTTAQTIHKKSSVHVFHIITQRKTSLHDLIKRATIIDSKQSKLIMILTLNKKKNKTTLITKKMISFLKIKNIFKNIMKMTYMM